MAPAQYIWRDRNGHAFTFDKCDAGGCWATPSAENPSIVERLQRRDGGFLGVAADGTRYVYESAWAAVGEDGGSAPVRHYFLTSFSNSQGQAVATVTYAQPDAGGCAANGLGTFVPYISQIEGQEGARLALDYARYYKADGGGECVITGVEIENRPSDGGGAVFSLAGSYAYTSDAGTVRPGLLAEASTPRGTQLYDYSGGDMSMVENASTAFSHSFNSVGQVATDLEMNHSYSVSYDSTQSCASGSDCCGKTPIRRTVSDSYSGRGDGVTGSAGFSTAYDVLDSAGQLGTPRTYQMTDSCTVDGGCSPGTQRWEWTCSMDGGLDYEKAYKDKRDHWEVHTKQVSWDAGYAALERNRSIAGAPRGDCAGVI